MNIMIDRSLYIGTYEYIFLPVTSAATASVPDSPNRPKPRCRNTDERIECIENS